MTSGTRGTRGPAPRRTAVRTGTASRSRGALLPIAACAFFLLLLLLGGGLGEALAERPALQGYAEALRLSQQAGEHEAAVEMLWKILREHGDDPVADDALFQIGEIAEKRIGDFDRAEEAYGLLLERVPRSRNHARAEQRLDRLRQDRAGGGDEPLRILNRIQAGFSEMGEEAALARLRDLYREWPDFTRRDDVVYMIAEAEYRRKNYDAALAGYEELLRDHPGSDRTYYVLGKIGKTQIERRDFAAARRAFERVAAYEEAVYGTRRSWDEHVRQLALFLTLRTLFLLSLGISAAALAVWLGGTRWREVDAAALRRAAVPAAALSALFLVAVLLSLKKPWTYTATLLAAWGVLGPAAFLNRLFVCTRTPGRAGAVLAAAGALLASAALAYAVYYGMDMVNLLYDSIHYSMESGEW